MKKIFTIAAGVTASVLALGAMAAVAGPIVYRGIAASPTTTRLPTVLPTVRSGAVDTDFDSMAELSGDWGVADGSEAGYTVGAMLNGSAVSIVGSTQHVTGTATVKNSVLSAASVQVDVASISSDNANRDAYFRGPALDTDQFPTAVFSLTEPITLEEEILDGAPLAVQATGTLQLHGVTHDVEVPLTAVLSDGRLTLSGAVPVAFAEYGVQAPDLGFVTVDESGSIDFSLAVTQR